MQFSRTTAALAAALAFGAASAIHAQMPTWNAEQKSVWAVVEQSWVDEVAQNGKWPADYADPQMIGWGSDQHSPRGKHSIAKWSRYSDSQGKTIQYEITPQAIAISGSTAVVTYVATTVRQRGTDKPEQVQEALTETLVKSGGTWKFLASVTWTVGK